VRRRAEARGLTPLTRLTWRGEGVNRPHFIDGGAHVMYGDASGRDRQQIAQLDTVPRSADGKQRPRTLLRYYGEYPHPFPDGRYVFFGQNETWNTYYYYDDLFIWDRQTGKTKQLTFGRRAREAAISHDGRHVTYVVNNLGTTSLAMADLDFSNKDGTGPRLINERILYRGPDFTQVATPVFSPDGQEIAYSTWEAGGFRDIVVYDLTTGKRRHLFRDRAVELDPRYSPDGKYLYFSSDRTGIYNLYALERASGELYQATNVLGGVFSPDISPDGKKVVFVGFNSYGYDIYTAPLDPATWPKAEPFLDDRPDVQQVANTAVYPVTPYSALPTLRPFNWTPGIGVDPFGGSALTLHIDGGDIVGWHSYSLDAIIGFQRGDAQLAATYIYSRLWPDLMLGFSRFIGPRGGFLVNGVDQGYIEEDYTLAAGVDFPILRSQAASADLQVIYNLNWYRPASSLKFPLDPNDQMPQLPQVGRHATLGLQATYSNTRSYQYSISPEEGRSISASVRVGHPYLGGEFHTAEIQWSWTEYISVPWRRWLPQHVLALRYGGGYGFGDLQRRGIYYISGLPQQDLIGGFFFGGRVGGATLRGYPYGAIYGDTYHLLNAEYRFPIVYVERGPWTTPVYLRRLYATVFYDVGNAYTGAFYLHDLKHATGFQLFIDHALGYVQNAQLVITYAHGFQPPGGDMVNVFFGSSF
jgi:Tol biopolymer transport system component